MRAHYTHEIMLCTLSVPQLGGLDQLVMLHRISFEASLQQSEYGLVCFVGSRLTTQYHTWTCCTSCQISMKADCQECNGVQRHENWACQGCDSTQNSDDYITSNTNFLNHVVNHLLPLTLKAATWQTGFTSDPE